MTSYRGDEAVDCVGMQPSVEPARGLCDYHKPTRFSGIEGKRLSGSLAMARLFLFQPGGVYGWTSFGYSLSGCCCME